MDRIGDLPMVTAGLGSGWPVVKGTCPACGRSSLFLGNGGWVTCSMSDCPNPGAASEALVKSEPAAECAEERGMGPTLDPLRQPVEAVRPEVVAQAINDIIVTHPMWIDDNGADLDYTPERESRISDFIEEASKAVVHALAESDAEQKPCLCDTDFTCLARVHNG